MWTCPVCDLGSARGAVVTTAMSSHRWQWSNNRVKYRRVRTREGLGKDLGYARSVLYRRKKMNIVPGGPCGQSANRLRHTSVALWRVIAKVECILITSLDTHCIFQHSIIEFGEISWTFHFSFTLTTSIEELKRAKYFKLYQIQIIKITTCSCHIFDWWARSFSRRRTIFSEDHILHCGKRASPDAISDHDKAPSRPAYSAKYRCDV